jgi:hypothetical protein
MSEYVKDVLGLVVGTVLVMLVWFALGGGTYRLSPDAETASRSRSVSTMKTVTVGLER